LRLARLFGVVVVIRVALYINNNTVNMKAFHAHSLLLVVGLFLHTFHVSGQFMAGSEARNFEREAKAPSGSVFDAAMTSDMNAASGNIFQIDSFQTEKITNAALQNHITKFLKRPVSFKLTKELAPKRGGNTYRAFVKTAQGTKLRGFWRRGPDQETLKSRDMMELSYDEALRRRGSAGSQVDFEIQLPPLKGYLPSVVYSVVLGTGASNRESSVAKSVALIKIHPKGMDAKGFSLGKTTICQPMRAGIVDPSWCKGKTIFRQGRSVGQV
jgi:hypothetical protein